MTNEPIRPVRAIKVKYLPATNHRGSRHKADLVGVGLTLTMGFDYSENDGGALKTALALLEVAKRTPNLEHWADAKIESGFNADGVQFFVLSL